MNCPECVNWRFNRVRYWCIKGYGDSHTSLQGSENTRTCVDEEAKEEIGV